MNLAPLKIWLLLTGAALAQIPAEDEAFFESRIRPLFSQHCVECHGEKKQESGLRLDLKAGWMKGGDSGPALVPGDPEKSMLIHAVRRGDPDSQMPPKTALKPEEIAALEQWVKRGAPDPRTGQLAQTGVNMEQSRRTHWAFQPLSRPALPEVAKPEECWQPMDHFIQARLQREGLEPNPVADRRTLIRRATFDLTGLPPTPEEIAAFLQDDSPGAFAKLVDRLLESPAYGERWGRHWLDVARYADTAGDGSDYPVREAYQYRDWVIRALNADQPIDQFIREQIAGDLLAKEGTPEQLADRVTATGFLAVGKRFGYSPKDDYQYLDFADAIDSVGRSFLGLSLGCARCHDHKYDPVTAADYYAMYGIFQSTRWAFPGGEVQKRPSHFAPLVPAAEAKRLDEVKTAALAAKDAEIAQLKKDREALNANVIAGGIDLGLESQALNKAPGAPWFTAGPSTVLAEAQSPFSHVHPAGTRGVRLGSGKPTEGLRYVFAGIRGKPMHFTLDFRTLAGKEPGAYRLYLGRGVVQSQALEVSISAKEIALKDGEKWSPLRPLVPGTWYTLRLSLDPARKTYSGVVGKPGDLTAFADKQLNPRWDGVADTFICDGFGHIPGAAPARDLDNLGLQEASFGEPGSGPVTAPPAPPDLPERIKKLDADIAGATKAREVEAVRDLYPVAYGVTEDKPTNARIQLRGEPDKPGEEVPRRLLEVLGGDLVPLEGAESGRRQLADWLTRSSNPLTPRVFVNRVWQWHFGEGLAATESDFGLRGEAPSHPELLDWLTAKFVDSGWSLKDLHRLIMNSRTYQQSSGDHRANLKADPANRLLWRYSRRALDAESIRDAMLAVSGRLDRAIPGPHPFPPVNTWAFTIHRPFHETYDSDHRSVYLMVQRTRRHPFLALFDAADPNMSVDQRLPTTTPAQALYLMNSPFVQQQAKAFAERMLNVTEGERIAQAFELAHGRVPSGMEIQEAQSFLEAYRQNASGLVKTPREADELAWAGLGRVLLTSNAFLYVD